jgi:hypothetical protein
MILVGKFKVWGGGSDCSGGLDCSDLPRCIAEL